VRILLAASLLVLAACGTDVARGAPSASAAPAARTPSPTPTINVDDMMGQFAQQTVFVVTSERVAAITLLNHFTRYEIPTNGTPQVALDATGAWLYVLDGPAGAARLRTFDVPNGTERASSAGIAGARVDIANVASDRHALATAIDGRVLVLKSDGTRAWVDAYEALSLRPLGTLFAGPNGGCADRLLSSGSRIAVLCDRSGDIAYLDVRGDRGIVEGTLPGIVAATMTEDGTIYLGTGDGALASVPIGGTKKVARISWPSDWARTLLPDALAVSQGWLLVAQQGDAPYLRMFQLSDQSHRQSTLLSGTPQGGILALWPFVYYTQIADRCVHHVDLIQGLLEVMRCDIGTNARPGAVANR